MDLKAWLAAEAQALGFARVGFTDCGPFDGARFNQWLADGGLELFPYLGSADRLDPRRLLENVKTAIVGFFPYARPDAIPGRTPGSLKVSRYVWGPDYHHVLKVRLKDLLARAQAQIPGLEGRVCVDTAPLLERQLAVRAGLGWQGRHTLLITGKGGSWGFLGVLLLNVAMAPDPPFQGHRCGSCHACLDACPTSALSEFHLDPALCLTTYTVETEREPPARVLAALRETQWVAGCDRCQEVCPWNKAPLWGDATLWGGESPLHTLPAGELPRGTAQWKKHTQGSALRRVRHRHWIANLKRVLPETEK